MHRKTFMILICCIGPIHLQIWANQLSLSLDGLIIKSSLICVCTVSECFTVSETLRFMVYGTPPSFSPLYYKGEQLL